MEELHQRENVHLKEFFFKFEMCFNRMVVVLKVGSLCYFINVAIVFAAILLIFRCKTFLCISLGIVNYLVK